MTNSLNNSLSLSFNEKDFISIFYVTSKVFAAPSVLFLFQLESYFDTSLTEESNKARSLVKIEERMKWNFSMFT